MPPMFMGPPVGGVNTGPSPSVIKKKAPNTTGAQTQTSNGPGGMAPRGPSPHSGTGNIGSGGMSTGPYNTPRFGGGGPAMMPPRPMFSGPPTGGMGFHGPAMGMGGPAMGGGPIMGGGAPPMMAPPMGGMGGPGPGFGGPPVSLAPHPGMNSGVVPPRIPGLWGNYNTLSNQAPGPQLVY